MRGVQSHLANNHSDLKESNADIYSWAASRSSNIDATAHATAIGNGTDAQVSKQSLRALNLGISSGAISSARAGEILANNNINKDIKGKQKANLGHIAGGGSTGSLPNP